MFLKERKTNVRKPGGILASSMRHPENFLRMPFYDRKRRGPAEENMYGVFSLDHVLHIKKQMPLGKWDVLYRSEEIGFCSLIEQASWIWPANERISFTTSSGPVTRTFPF